MDKEILKQEINNRPEEIKTYIKEQGWSLIVDSLVKELNLTEDQKRIIENEILFVLLGMELSANLISNLKPQLNLNDIVLENINKQIQDKIFSGLSEFLPSEIAESEGEPGNVPGPQPIENLAENPELPAEKINGTKDTIVPVPNYSSYDSGKDPYREPIE